MTRPFEDMVGKLAGTQWRDEMGKLRATAGIVASPDEEYVLCSQLGHKKFRGNEPFAKDEADDRIAQMTAFHGGTMTFWKERY